MREKVYEKYFTEEELSNLRFSEADELQREENSLTELILGLMIVTFLTFVMLVALTLWTNKFTIFLTTVVSVPTIIFYIFVTKSITGFKKLIDKYKKTAESRGLHE